MQHEKILDLTNLRLNILLVEDSRTDAYLVRRILGKYMTNPCNLHHVVCMADAEAALRLRDDIDLILLDLALPDTADGRETFARIGSLKTNIPVIVLSSADERELALLVVDGGPEDYVKKSQIGDHPDVLCDAINFAVSRRKYMAS